MNLLSSKKYLTPNTEQTRHTTQRLSWGQTVRSHRGVRRQHGGTLGRRSGGTITRQHMEDRLPNSAAMGQGLAITLERNTKCTKM